MIFAFETVDSDVLTSFLYRYEYPDGLLASLSKLSFLEFKIIRVDDLVIVSQTHLYDVVAKWLLLASVADLLFAYSLGYPVLFFLGGLFALVSILWLSKYVRYFALFLQLKRRGHKGRIVLINDSLLIRRLLNKYVTV